MQYSQKTLPPSSGYYAYGSTPQYGEPYVVSGNVAKTDSNLEAQDEIKPIKVKQDGFQSFSNLDYLMMTIVFFAPLFLYAVVDMLMSFYWHYKYMVLDWLLVILIFVLVGWVCSLAMKRMLKKADGFNDHKAIWAAALVIGMVMGFFSALAFGLRNYSLHTQQYYEWKELNSYTGVDPSKMDGKAFMDAGIITFNPGSHLDLSKSTGFMNLDMYCVAPIVSAGQAPASYDFWAVGVNCCTGAPQNFACGQASHSDKSTGGLRLMSDSKLPFFQMAVTQAMTTHGIKSAHPIFVHWVEDASKALADYQTTSWDNFLFTLMCFAVFQAIVVVASALGVMIVKSKYT